MAKKQKPTTTDTQSYAGVAVVAPYHLPYQKRSNKSATWFIGTVLQKLLQQGAVAKEEVDGLLVSSFTLAPDSVVSLLEHFSMTVNWLEQLPTGGAGGPLALKRAARAIQNGDAEIVACIGADTANEHSFNELIENFSSFSAAAVYPYAAAGPNMVFSMITQHYMQRYGISREDCGKLCIAQRGNALAAGTSLFDQPLTMQDYLAARPIAEPLHLYDCVMPVAGGDGFLLMSVERAQSLQLPYAEVLAAVERHNAFYDDPVHFRGGWLECRDKLYALAGVGPEDMDFLQTYDDYPVISMMQMENLGFCEPDALAEFISNTDFAWDGGGLPHNTCGGQLSAGQAGAAGGFLGTVEALKQLLQQGLLNQVPNAKRGMVSGYGMVNFDRCLCTSAVILSRGGQT
ncbi:MAG: thiolase family protein [Gammaproteobacteria bacterium]